MVNSNLTPAQIEQAIKKLPLKDRAKILKNLQKNNWKKEWNDCVNNIRVRAKKSPISQKDILAEIKAYRREKNAKNNR